jgi:hypothetical protein
MILIILGEVLIWWKVEKTSEFCDSNQLTQSRENGTAINARS